MKLKGSFLTQEVNDMQFLGDFSRQNNNVDFAGRIVWAEAKDNTGKTLLDADGTATQRELTAILGVNRKMLKDIIRKAQRNDYVTIEDAEGKKTYAVKLTDEGRKVAEKHEKAQDKIAEQILATLTDEERAQLDAINEKLIIACKEAGIDGKKKGRKHHRKGRKHSRRIH